MEAIYSSDTKVDFQLTTGVISQKTEIFNLKLSVFKEVLVFAGYSERFFGK
jgi:hypothetical protein